MEEFSVSENKKKKVEEWKKNLDILELINPLEPLVSKSKFYLAYLESDKKNMLHHSKYIDDETFVKFFYKASWSTGLNFR